VTVCPATGSVGLDVTAVWVVTRGDELDVRVTARMFRYRAGSWALGV
jgi:hypothetical protein